MVQPKVGFIFYCLLFYIFILFLLCPTFGREHFFQGLGSLTFFFLWLSFIIFHFQSLIGHFSQFDESLIRRSESGRWKKTTDEDEEWVPTHSFQALIINFGSRVLTFGEQMLRSDSWFVFDDKVVDESLVTVGWRPIKPWPPTILTDHILSFSLVFDHQVSWTNIDQPKVAWNLEEKERKRYDLEVDGQGLTFPFPFVHHQPLHIF